MIIELLNGTRYDIADYSLKRLFHFIPSANIVNSNYELEGRSDYITNGRLNNRVIRVELLYITQDIYDYYLLRDELNNLLMRDEEFYIIFKREPNKRWLVRNNVQFEVPPNPHMQSFVVEFITQNFYAESVGTSLDLQNRKEWDVDLWAWDNTIDWDTNYPYTFSGNQFIVNNFGNIVVDPRYAWLETEIRAHPTGPLTITNTTTSDTYIYNGALTSSDTLLINGVRTLKNGVSDFANTNRQLLTLAVGTNNFIVNGGTIESIQFRFRFLYK